MNPQTKFHTSFANFEARHPHYSNKQFYLNGVRNGMTIERRTAERRLNTALATLQSLPEATKDWIFVALLALSLAVAGAYMAGVEYGSHHAYELQARAK